MNPGTPPTGRQFELRHGVQYAVVTEVGAALRAYRVGDRDAIVPFDAAEMSPAAHGAVLVPWPNRIRDGRYTFDGQTHQLPLTEPERDNAIHGLALWTRWECLEHTDAEVTLRLDLVPQPGYPFALRVDLTYRLDDDDGLTVTSHATNTGDRPAPYGIGFHPWLSPGAHALDDCTLQVPATTWVRPDDRLLPVDEVAIPDMLDFRTPRVLDDTVLDDAFVDVPPGRPTVHLVDPDGVDVACWFDEGLSCWQLCSGDDLPVGRRRSGLAVEPMSCTADAFRTGRRLVRLEPGAAHTTRHGVRVTRP